MNRFERYDLSRQPTTSEHDEASLARLESMDAERELKAEIERGER